MKGVRSTIFLCLVLNIFSLFSFIKADSHILNKGKMVSTGPGKLFRWPTEEVGNVRDIELGDGSVVSMITKSKKPAVFTVDNFLSSQECEDLVKMAENKELKSALDEDREQLEKMSHTRVTVPPQFLDFNTLDENKNGRIDLIEEVQSFTYKFNSIYLNEFEVNEIFKIFRVEVKSHGGRSFIEKSEFAKLDLKYFFEYIDQLKKTHPIHSDRHFEYTSFNLQNSEDPLLKGIYSKIQTLTNIDTEILKGMEPLEVTKYDPYGHHFAHFESTSNDNTTDLPCCHLSSSIKKTTCRHCRFLTVMVYLNEDGGPGETIFPVADDPTYSYQKFMDRSDHDLTNVIHHCDKSKLIIRPKKGTAVMWYNHEVSSDGALGPFDPYSLSGECNVYFNHKWAAYTRVVASESSSLMTKSIHRPDYGDNLEFEKQKEGERRGHADL